MPTLSKTGKSPSKTGTFKSPFLTLYSMITPLKYHVFENIMENEAFAFLEQMLHFLFIIFS